MIFKNKILLFCVGLVAVVCLLSFFPTATKAEYGYDGILLSQNSDGTYGKDIFFIGNPTPVSSKISAEEYNAGMAGLTSDQYEDNPLGGVGAKILGADNVKLFEDASLEYRRSNGEVQQVEGVKKGGPGVFDQAGNFFLWIVHLLLYIASIIVGLLLYISGRLIDFFFGANQLASSQIVQSGWLFTRDTLNFVFILILLTISFSTIAGLDTLQMKKALPSLIFAALLVNFSLAIGGAFLQVSNVMTESIATSIIRKSDGTKVEKNKVGSALVTGLLNSSHIKNFYTKTDVEWIKGLHAEILLPAEGTQAPSLDNVTKLDFLSYLQTLINSAIALVMICIFTASFVFLAALMAIRIVMLVILLILSPVPFVFSIIPQAKSYATKWWDNFIKYVIFLPVATFFLALAIRIMDTKTATPLVNQFFKAGTAPSFYGAGTMGSIIDMIFVTIFIFASLIVAKSLGIMGGGAALGAAKKIGMGAARIGVFPAVAAGKMAGHGAAKVGLMAADTAGNLAAKTPLVGSVLKGARMAGRGVQRLYKGQESREQIEEKKKALAGMSEDELRSAYERGNVVAGVKLMENDDLKKEEYAGLSAKVPKSTEAYNKVQTNWKRKDPIGAVMGSELRGELLSASPLNKSSQDKVDKHRDDLQTAFKKIKPEDYAKLDGDDLKAAIKAGVKVPLTKPQLDATMGSTNTDLQKAVSEHITYLEDNPTTINPGQQATVEYARNKLKMKKP